MIHFVADFHLRHKNILKHCPARAAAFANIDEMDKVFISECNRVVKPNDELWVIGDVIWGPGWYGHYREKLNVRNLHVVLGNHDKPSIAKYVSSCVEAAYVKLCGIRFHLFHHPIVSWRGRSRGSIHLYGHCHGTMEDTLNRLFPGRYSMDVGIDNAFRLLGEWRPFSIDEILQFMPHCLVCGRAAPCHDGECPNCRH